MTTSNVIRDPQGEAGRYLYEKIVDSLTQQIQVGSLKPGERLLSVRKLSKQLDVSVSSVIQAYIVLEAQGFVEARPQSGYYVRGAGGKVLLEPEMSNPVSASVVVNVHDLVRDVIKTATDPSIIQLGAAVPCPSLIPATKLQRLHNEIIRKHGGDSLTYNFAPGNYEFRRAMSQRALIWGCQLSADDIVLTNGAIEAVNLCLRAVAKPGDIIAVESPLFFGILETIESLGMHVLELPTHPRNGVNVKALEAAIKQHRIQACVFMPNFNNPLGCLMPTENKEMLVNLLARHEIPLIENDVHGDLHFAAKRPVPAKAFDKKGLVLYCTSFSKSLAPSFRVGWTAPGRFRERVRSLKYMTSTATPTLSQMVVAAFVQSGGYDKHLREVQRAFKSQVYQATQACQNYFPKETKLSRPQGGHLMWVEFPSQVDSIKLHQDAFRHHGISIAPGNLFSASQKYKSAMRLNCGYPWSPQLDQAIRIIGELAHQQMV